MEIQLKELKNKAKKGLDQTEAEAKLQIEIIKKKIEEIGDKADDRLDIIIAEYNIIEDQLEKRYKSFLSKIKTFLAKLFKKVSG